MSFRHYVLGEIFVTSPFVDPFGAGNLLMAMSARIAADPRDRIEIHLDDFAGWLDAKTISHPDFNVQICFRKLRRQIGFPPMRPIEMVCSDQEVSFFVSSGPDAIVIDILNRRFRGPKLTRGQMHRLHQLIKIQSEITPETIAWCRAEALSKNWPSPCPGLCDDQPVEIIIKQVSLSERIKRFFARIR